MTHLQGLKLEPTMTVKADIALACFCCGDETLTQQASKDTTPKDILGRAKGVSKTEDSMALASPPNLRNQGWQGCVV